MKTPEKIYLYPYSTDGIYEVETKPLEGTVEYTRTDVFIDKACEFLKSYRQELYDGMGYIAGIIDDKTIEDFRKCMKGE